MLAAHGPPQRVVDGDFRWLCTAYTALTGREDLTTTQLASLPTAPPPTRPYLEEKLSLLAHALSEGGVRNPRGFLLRAIEHDWRAESAPPRRADVVARLQALGVSAAVAAGLVRDHTPEAVSRQLAWLPFRSVQDQARGIVRAVRGDWGEPRAAREARTMAGRDAIRQDLLDRLETARVQAAKPEARAAGAQALAAMREHLGLSGAPPPRLKQ